ncbi:YaiI/YqxD family protein [Alginatibacterium sediminis]|uniref:UPF0178 protein DBZ36_12850 n=1 Tax=Alginatibacterium sediminis TaxID=2164068 RepID=A0A420EBQ6_9ALTE|nr:YaiI/YqxD family protein [Alginatibacterium sediminis]RKF18118.1 YaiI/YqxD family protein [Alginatibacterium sediminis]
MSIWVDADACPAAIRDIIIRAAERTSHHCCFVANHYLAIPKREFLQFVQVPSGFDVADHEIVRRAQAGDLVITSDIPLAAEVIEKGGLGLSVRGEQFNANSIGERLNMRDFMDTMRSSAVSVGGGPPPLSNTDKQQFANALDRWLSQQKS